MVFRPTDVPKIESVRFEGAQAIPAGTLETKLNPVAKGSPFTEYDVKQLLDVNIRPMYEEFGRLNVSFPLIKADGGAVTVRVDEGRVYNIGQVRSTGDGPAISLAAGQIANWRKVNEALEEAAGSFATRDIWKRSMG